MRGTSLDTIAKSYTLDSLTTEGRVKLEPLLLTIDAAATLLSTTDRKARALCRDGTLTARRIGRQWRVHRASVEEYAAQCDAAAPSRTPPAHLELVRSLAELGLPLPTAHDRHEPAHTPAPCEDRYARGA